ncbi:MAG: GNAT family N-acetyltransferase [Ignavibacteriae bacterium]|nr:MAG: GNAT family N-acetyltransferase [Ignavibacteriota bacterium]
MKYQNNLVGITPSMLEGFFVKWGSIYPSQQKHFEILQNSAYIVLAVDDEINKVIGFVNAISDKILSVYIPLLEVLPAYKIKGVGIELMKRMMAQLKDFYMIDLCCDDRHIKGYGKFGFIKSNGMIIRNYDKKDGK